MSSCFAVGREQLNPGRVMWCDGKDDGAGRNLCVAVSVDDRIAGIRPASQNVVEREGRRNDLFTAHPGDDF